MGNKSFIGVSELSGMRIHVGYGEVGIDVPVQKLYYNEKTKCIEIFHLLTDAEFKHLSQKIIDPEIKEKIIQSQELSELIREKVEALKNNVTENKIVD